MERRQRQRPHLVYVIVCMLIICGSVVSPSSVPRLQAQAPSEHTLYLPLVMERYPSQSFFGVQAIKHFTNSTLLSQTLNLKAGWVRIGPISWRTLQPNQGDPIRWQLLASLEQELRALKQA